MNRIRRKRIAEIIDALSDLQETINMIREEEDESRENMPENMQYGDRYYASEECSDWLEEAYESIDSALDTLGNI